MRRGLTLNDVPPRGYHSDHYWAVKIAHDFYASGDEVWEVTAADLPGDEMQDKHRSALINAMSRHGAGRVVVRAQRLYLISNGVS